MTSHSNEAAVQHGLAELNSGLETLLDQTAEIVLEPFFTATDKVNAAVQQEKLLGANAHLAIVRTILTKLSPNWSEDHVERLCIEFELENNALRLGAGLSIAVGLFGSWREEPVDKHGGARRYHWRTTIFTFVRALLTKSRTTSLRHEFLRAIRPLYNAFYADCDQQDEFGFAIDLIEYFGRGTNSDVVATTLFRDQKKNEVNISRTGIGTEGQTPSSQNSPADKVVEALGLDGVRRFPEPILDQLRAICLTQCILVPCVFEKRIHLYLILPLGGVLRFELDFAEIEDVLMELTSMLPDPRRYRTWLPHERIRDMRARREKLSDETITVLQSLFESLFRRSEPLGGWKRNLVEEIDNWDGLYVVPSEDFPWIPWHLLRDGERFVFQRWGLSYFPSLTVMYSVLCYRAGFMYGSPAATIDDPRSMPYFVTEGTTVQSSVEATEICTLLEMNGLTTTKSLLDYGFAHLAGHGASHSSGLEYKVQQGDRWISTKDVLTGALKSRAIMVNACDVCALGTSLPDDIPLLLALFAAGNRNILGSCWPIRDTAAHAFALEYDKALMVGQSCVAAWSSALGVCLREPADLLDFGGYMIFGAIDDQVPEKLEKCGDFSNESGFKLLQQGDTLQALSKFFDARIHYLRACCWEGDALACENITLAYEARGEGEQGFEFMLEYIASWAAHGKRGADLLAMLSTGLVDTGRDFASPQAQWGYLEKFLGLLLEYRGLSIEEAEMAPDPGWSWAFPNGRVAKIQIQLYR